MKEEFTYAKAGVDISKIKKSHKFIADLLKETFSSRDGKFGKVLTEIGHYAGLIDIGNNKVLALHVDGVGTKVLISQMLNRYDTVGIDCVAMCVNDIICMGAEPVALVDYLAIEEPNDEMIGEITKGLVKGTKQADIAIVGGETAVMKDVITGVKGKGFDLAAMCVGVVDKDKIITGENIKVGDVVIGLESSGLHSNGYSLCRKVLLKKHTVNDPLPTNSKITIGKELLKPTRIYVKPILEILRKGIEVHGLAHITGGAFTKLRRLKKGVGYDLNFPEPYPVFKAIQQLGNVSDKEMYKVFNMNVGFCVITTNETYPEIIKLTKKFGVNSFKIGEVTKDPNEKIRIKRGKLDFILD